MTMYFTQVQHLKYISKVKLAELLWSGKTVSNIMLNLIPKPLCYIDLKKEHFQDGIKVIRKWLSELEITPSIKTEVDRLIEPIGCQIIDWINNLSFIFYGSNDHCEIVAKKYYVYQLIWNNWGTINKKSTVKMILKNPKLSVERRYQLACIFCCESEVSDLWAQLSSTEKTEFLTPQGIENLDLSGEIINPLIIYWSFLVQGHTDRIVSWEERGKNVNEHMAAWAIRNNNQDAFMYFWNNLTEIEIMENIGNYVDICSTCSAKKTITREEPLNGGKKFLYMNDVAQLYANINAFLLPHLSEQQMIEIVNNNAYNLLMCFFLNWLWHFHFKRIVNQWDSFNDNDLARLLLGVIEKSSSANDLKEYKTCLEILINKNPIVFRKTLLLNNCSAFWKLFTLRDSAILKLVLNVLNTQEKTEIIKSENGVARCSDLIMKGEFDYLDLFLDGALVFDEDKANFRVNMFQMSDSLCNYLLMENKFDWFVKFVKWSGVSEEEIEFFKNDLIEMGHMYFHLKVLLLNHFSLESFSNFVTWCFSGNEERIAEFKKDLLENETAHSYCAHLVQKDRRPLAIDFLRWCGKTTEEAEQILKDLFTAFEAVLAQHRSE